MTLVKEISRHERVKILQTRGGTLTSSHSPNIVVPSNCPVAASDHTVANVNMLFNILPWSSYALSTQS